MMLWKRLATNPHLAMTLASLIFGANYVVGRAMVGEVPPFLLGFTRWAAAAVILLPFAWASVRRDWPLVRRSAGLLALAGLLMPFLGAGLGYYALTKTIAVNAGIVQTSLPIFTVLLAWLVLHERATGRQAVGVAVAVIGVIAIVVRGEPSKLLDLQLNTGDLILVLCNVALAGYSIAVKRLPPELGAMTVLIAVFAIGAACHAPFMLAELAAGDVVQPTANAVFGLLFVAVFPSVVAITCWNRGIVALGVNRAGFYMYLVPVFAAVLAAATLGERIEGYHLVGGALIVAGVTLCTRKPTAANAVAAKPGIRPSRSRGTD